MKKVPVILAIVLFLGWLLSTQLIRRVWLLLALALVIAGAVRRPRERRTILTCAAVAALVIAVGSWVEPWTELARFTLLRGGYEQSAQSVTRELEHIPGMSWHSEKGSLFLTNRREIICDKDQSGLTLYYQVKNSFFNSYGFLYASQGVDSVAGGHFSPDQVDEFYPIDDCWAYVKIY